MKILLMAIAIALFSVGAYASSNSVTTTMVQDVSGTLTNIYFETANGASGSTPTTNTGLTPSSVSGSYSITRGSSLNLWSTQFPSATTIPAGKWILDMWVQSSALGPMTVSIVVTTSTGSTSATVVSSTSTPNLSSSKNQVVLSYTGSGVTVPSGGYIKVTLTAPTGSGRPSFTVFWGISQLTNFQYARRILT